MTTTTPPAPAPPHLTVTAEHVTEALRHGSHGVIVRQTDRLDDWLGTGPRAHYADQLTTGFLTVVADGITLHTLTRREGIPADVAAALDAYLNLPTHAPRPGDAVITMRHDGTYTYDGPNLGRDSEALIFSMRHAHTLLRASWDRVAPADTPLADPKDPRITIVNDKAGQPGPWVAGPWHLTLDGDPFPHGTWYRIKKDATQAAVRRLAILDYHAAHTA